MIFIKFSNNSGKMHENFILKNLKNLSKSVIPLLTESYKLGIFHMQRNVFLFLITSLIFCNQYYFACTKALLGTTVRNAAEGEFPSVVCIASTEPNITDPDDIIICTGVLISSRHVLSAEHCVDDDEPFQVIVGSNDVFAGVKKLPFWWLSFGTWAPHAGVVMEHSHNDIAIIILMEHADETIVPAIIAFQPNTFYVGLNVTMVGWGTTDNGTSPRTLKAVNVKVISNQECENLVLRLQGFPSSVPLKYICSIETPYAFLADGDSGGPIFHCNSLMGISEGICPRTDNQLHPEKANIFNSVYYYRNFITQVMEM